MELDPVVAHFESVADVYDEVLPFFSGFAREAVERIAPPAETRALDLAAGRGAFTSELLSHGAKVVVVDAAPRMVELLNQDHPGVEAHVMDLTHPELRSDTFDLVTCGFALHIVSDARAAFDEACRVLKPGGQLALTVPGRADGSPDPWDDPLVDLYAEYRRYQADGVGRHGNDIDEAALLTESDLVDISATTLEVAIPVPDGDTYWRWSRSHGSGRFIDGLADEKRNEMRSLLLARIEATRVTVQVPRGVAR